MCISHCLVNPKYKKLSSFVIEQITICNCITNYACSVPNADDRSYLLDSEIHLCIKPSFLGFPILWQFFFHGDHLTTGTLELFLHPFHYLPGK